MGTVADLRRYSAPREPSEAAFGADWGIARDPARPSRPQQVPLTSLEAIAPLGLRPGEGGLDVEALQPGAGLRAGGGRGELAGPPLRCLRTDEIHCGRQAILAGWRGAAARVLRAGAARIGESAGQVAGTVSSGDRVVGR